MALVIACAMELATGGISQNLLLVIIAFMGANVVKDVGLNWMERRDEKVPDPCLGGLDPHFSAAWARCPCTSDDSAIIGQSPNESRFNLEIVAYAVRHSG